MASSDGPSSKTSYFEHQRALLLNDVAVSLENVLQNINKLNRTLEGVIAVGNEFSQVEGLWSHLESVMAKDAEKETNSGITKAGGNDDGPRS